MASNNKDKSVVYNYLGKAGIKVSNLCLGTMTFGSHPDQETPKQCDENASHEIINKFVELGGNFLDTADVYNLGASEEIIGRWLERQTRDNFVIATKVRANMGVDKNINNIGLSRRHITASIDRSLERLHTNYIDVYQTHIWDKAVPLEETLRTLDDLVRCGKIRYAGASNVHGWQLQKLVNLSEKLGLNPFVSLQQQYNLLSRFSEFEPFAVCKMEGIAVLPWSPLKGGLLTGKFKRGGTPSEGRVGWVAEKENIRASQAGPAWSAVDDRSFDIIESVEKIAQKKGRSPAQVALRWLLQKDIVSSVIIGATKLSQLEDNMKAGNGWTLSAEEMKELDDVSAIPQPYPYEMVLRLNQPRKNPFLQSQEVSNVLPQ